MASFRAGKSGRTVVTSQTLAMLEWSVTNRGGDLDTTSFESNGIEEGLIGIIGADWTLRGNWDASKNPLDDPPGLYPRDNGTAMMLYTNVTDNKGYSFPFWRCLNSKITTNATGLVTFDADGKNQGPFSEPTGSTSFGLPLSPIGGAAPPGAAPPPPVTPPTDPMRSWSGAPLAAPPKG